MLKQDSAELSKGRLSIRFSENQHCKSVLAETHSPAVACCIAKDLSLNEFISGNR